MRTHPQPALLDRLWAGDLGGDLRIQVAAHAEGCAGCRSYLDGLSSEKEAQLAAVPPGRFVQQLEERLRGQQRRKRRLWLGAGAAFAAAAAASLLLVPRPGEERAKGAAISGLVVHRKRGDQVRMLEAGARIRAGDSLRVAISLSHPARAAVWFVDARGEVDTVLAPSALRGGEQTLPGSVVVASPCVDLWVVGAAGEEADGIEGALRRSLLARPPKGPDWLPAGAVARKLECEE